MLWDFRAPEEVGVLKKLGPTCVLHFVTPAGPVHSWELSSASVLWSWRQSFSRGREQREVKFSCFCQACPQKVSNVSTVFFPAPLPPAFAAAFNSRLPSFFPSQFSSSTPLFLHSGFFFLLPPLFKSFLNSKSTCLFIMFSSY